jgi:cytochrome c-type biogenesis protein CcmH/NrfF
MGHVMRLRTFVCVLACALLVAGGAAWAQGLADEPSATGGPPPWAYSMAHDLMSPFCPGRTLAACPSPQADELRQWILFQAAAGQSESEIRDILYERYGDVVLSAPKAEGAWGVSAYAIPIGGFVVGGAIVAFVITRLARGRVTQEEDDAATPIPVRTAASSMSDAELERLVDEEFAGS